MKRILAGVVIASAMALVWAVPALAHNVTSASLACANQASTLTVNYNYFTPDKYGHREVITVDFLKGTQVVLETSFTPTSDQGSHVFVGPAVASGTVLAASVKWAEGSLSVSPTTVTGDCQSPPPPPPTPPPTSTPTPVPTPPTPTLTPPTPTPPTPTPPQHHHRPACVKIAASRFHASIGPQGLIRGNATLRASGPMRVQTIRVTIHGAGGHVWVRTYHRHTLQLPLAVTSTAIFGQVNGSPYDTHVRVFVRFRYACGTTVRPLTLNNQDPPKRV